MDLDLTPEQQLLREMVRSLCARHADLKSVRALEDDAVGFSPGFYSQLGDVGLIGMTLPEEHGGSGMSMLDAALVYIELGRALAPSPHFVSSVLSSSAIALAG